MQSLLVFDASDLQIIDGVHFGDTLSFANDLILDDVYILSPEASLKPLVFDISGNFLKISKIAVFDVAKIAFFMIFLNNFRNI